MPDLLISLENVSVTRGGHALVRDISWQLKPGEHWAVAGANGSGKTSLLRLMRGELHPDPGGIRRYDFGDGPQSTPLGVRQRIALVSADMQDFYRLHAPRAVARDVALAGFFDTPLLYESPTAEQEQAVANAFALLGIRELADREMGTLSTGQARKVLLARAVSIGPDVILLDEALDGLDRQSRADMLPLLERIGERAALICAAHRASDVPSCVSRVLVMEKGRILARGGVEALAALGPDTPAEWPESLMPSAPDLSAYPFLVRVSNASVVVNGKRILDAVNWEMKPGEHWAVLGANGAGKSTLLKLLLSEHAPYADGESSGTVERLGAMPMDQARQLIGVVSPDLQTRYARELGWEVTAQETVLSGFRGSVGMLDEPVSGELLSAREWLHAFGLEGLAQTPLRRLSYGQQRRVFLARALAPGPHLLLLDEPFAGLDTRSRRAMRDMIQRIACSGTPVVLVTHHAGDIVPAISHVLELRHGKIVRCGIRSAEHAV